MAIPEAVRIQGERADIRLREEMERAQRTPVDPAQADPIPVEPEVRTEMEDVMTRLQAAEERAKRAEQRYETMRGKYDNEIPAAQKMAEEALAEVADLKIKYGTENRSNDPSLEESPEFVNFRDNFSDIYAGTRATARIEAENLFKERVKVFEENLLKKINPQLAKIEPLAATMTKTADDIYHERISEIESNWQAIRDNPDFEGWLREPEGETGYSRGQLMYMADQRRDSVTVGKYFKRGGEAIGMSAPAQSAVSLSASIPRSTVARRVESPRTTKRIWKKTEVKQFYKDLATGAYRNRQEEARKLSADIDAAIPERRIVDG